MDDIPKLDEQDIDALVQEFNITELQAAVFSMEGNKAPGPDGFLVDFYQKFWSLIKNDLKGLLDGFFAGTVNISRLNFGVISLLPKGRDADRIQKFRPICLLNVSFKIFTKLLAVRFGKIADQIISKSQTAFIKGRNILDGVVSLHEIVHEMKTSKAKGIILKLDFERSL